MMWLFFACAHDIIIAPDTSNMVEIIDEDAVFNMGYPDLDPGPYNNHWKASAKPQHAVKVLPFYIDRTEVTVGEFVEMLNQLMDYPSTLEKLVHPLMPITFDPETGFAVLADNADRPMHYVSWYEAMAYCATQQKRLPTEAEWEITAKGTDVENPRGVPWDTPGWGCHKATYYTNETLCADRPEPVGTHPDGDTPDGISDMGGNVSEWIFDWYSDYDVDPLINPVGPDSGTYKILRGGGFRESSDAMRVNDRVVANPKSRSEGIGFRCAVSSKDIGGVE